MSWRLPTKRELLRLYEYKAKLKDVDTKETSLFWSSIPYADYRRYAWGVDFNDGNDDFNKKDCSYQVRLVRESEDKLEWSTALGHMTWYEAVKLTESFNGEVYFIQQTVKEKDKNGGL